MDLIADIGATSTRFGLLDDKGRLNKSVSYRNDLHASLEDLIRQFRQDSRVTDKPSRAAFAIAAPILGDEIAMLNLDWRFSQSDLRSRLGVSRLIAVNDFAAVAWGLPVLRGAQLRQIGQGTPAARSAMGAIGPGSGLGVGGLVPAADGWAVISGEGGHVTLAPATELEARIIGAVHAEHGHCSAERLLSGPGLVRIYMELARIRDRTSEPLQPADVTALAQRGEPLAAEAMAVFFNLLGTVAGNLALTLGAHGGIFIAGGIIPRVADAFERSGFRERFTAKGRYRGYLEAIPTWLITDPVPAFAGLRTLLGYR